MGRPLSLSPRLMALARMVERGLRLADIGTDHARLPVFLVQHGIIDRAIAADIAEGPLERARHTVRLHHLEDRIELRLCDGALGIAPEEIDAAVIAGMGGDNIRAIIEASPWLLEKTLLLQPMTHAEKVEGFGFTRREEVSEGRRKYIILGRFH